MMLVHPGFRTCDDCQRWMYDPDTHERYEFPPHSGQPMERAIGSPLPCQSCPKCAGLPEKTPEAGRLSEISERNQMLLDLYYSVHGARIDTTTFDELTISNLGLVHELLSEHERGQTERMLTAGTMTTRILAAGLRR